MRRDNDTMSKLTEKDLIKELESDKSLREIAEKFETNTSKVFDLKDELGYKALNKVIDGGGHKRITVSDMLENLEIDNPNYWRFTVSGPKTVELEFFEGKWQKDSGFSKQNVDSEESS